MKTIPARAKPFNESDRVILYRVVRMACFFLFLGCCCPAFSQSLSIGLSEPKIGMFPSTIHTTELRVIRTGWDGQVSLSFSGLPPGVTGSMSALEGGIIFPPGSKNATFRIEASRTAPPGSWPITLRASGGGFQATSTITLVIRAPIYRATVHIPYVSYYDSPTNGRVEWDVQAAYTIEVDWTALPPRVRLNGDETVTVKSGPGNNLTRSVSTSAEITSKFPAYNVVLETLNGANATERVTVEGGDPIGGAGRVKINYSRPNGGMITESSLVALVGQMFLTNREERPNLIRKSSPAGSGTISVSSDPQNGYLPGAVVTLTATPQPGKAFAGWSGALTGMNNPTTITMSGDKTVTALFSELSSTIANAATAIAADGFTASWGAVDGALSYTIEISRAADMSGGISSFQAGSANSLRITGLSPLTNYYYRVRALGPNGTWSVSNIVPVVTLDVARPANDAFVDARTVAAAGTPFTGTNIGATGEVGEPTHVNSAGTASSVWYRLQPSMTGVVQIDTIGSSFDTVLAVYTGSSIGTLGRVVQDDDSGGAGTSRVQFTAQAGVSYSIAVGSFNSTRGSIVLNARFLNSTSGGGPQNDFFANATVVEQDGASLVGTNVGATGEIGEPIHVTSLGTASSVWYRWQPNINGEVQIDTIGSAVDTVIAVYTGSSVNALTRIAQDDDSGGGGTSKVRFTAQSGVTYSIAVGSYVSSRGNFILSTQVVRALVGPKTNQTISFLPLGPLTYGDTPVALSATASSGLPVVLEVLSTNPAGIASLSGSTLTISGAGTVHLRATQPGNFSFRAATPVTRTITINKAPLAVSFDPISRLVGRANPAFTLVYSGFVNGDDASDLDAAPRGVTKAALSSAEGRYPVTFTGGSDNNYRFVPGAPAWLTVEGFSGAYEALLVDSAGTPRGKLELLVPGNALTFTGTLNLDAEPGSIAVRGSLAAEDGGSAIGSWTRSAIGVSALELRFELRGDALVPAPVAGHEFSLVRNGEDHLELATGSRVFVQTLSGKTKLPAPWVGLHTLVLAVPASLDESDTRAVPLGAGHASLSVGANGVMSFRGRLVDGATLTGNARAAFIPPDSDEEAGRFRVFLRPYGRRLGSFFAGEFELVAHPDQARFPGRYHLPATEGAFAWSKAASPAKPLDSAYRAGFAVNLNAAIAPWLAPSAKAAGLVPAGNLAQRLGLAETASESVFFDLSGPVWPDGVGLGSRADDFPTLLQLSPAGVFSVAEPRTSPANITAFSLKVTPATGALSGSFTLSDIPEGKTMAVRRKVTVSGTLIQGADASDPIGHAHFLFDPSVYDDDTEQVSGELILLSNP